MATRKNAETAPEVATAPEVNEGSPRSRGNYKDSEPIEIKIDSTDRPYSEAVTEEHKALLEKYGQLRA